MSCVMCDMEINEESSRQFSVLYLHDKIRLNSIEEKEVQGQPGLVQNVFAEFPALSKLWDLPVYLKFILYILHDVPWKYHKSYKYDIMSSIKL